MARGNHVDTIKVIRKFGLLIITPENPSQSFIYYDKIYISKNGTLIGQWGSRFNEKYKDYLMLYGIDPQAKLLKRTNNYLFFKEN